MQNTKSSFLESIPELLSTVHYGTLIFTSLLIGLKGLFHCIAIFYLSKGDFKGQTFVSLSLAFSIIILLHIFYSLLLNPQSAKAVILIEISALALFSIHGFIHQIKTLK